MCWARAGSSWARPVPAPTARRRACPRITKMDPTTIGELDGVARPRSAWLAETLGAGGMQTALSDAIQGVLWSKFITNCCIQRLVRHHGGCAWARSAACRVWPPCAGRLSRNAWLSPAAKHIALEYPDPIGAMKPHTWRKFTQPSMLQMIEQGRPIEIEAINGWLLKEAAALASTCPSTAPSRCLARGRAAAVAQAGTPPDYAVLTRAGRGRSCARRGRLGEDVLADPGP